MGDWVRAPKRGMVPRAQAIATTCWLNCYGMLYDWQEHAGSFEVMNPGKMTGTLHMDVHAALISSESDLDSSAAMAQPI